MQAFFCSFFLQTGQQKKRPQWAFLLEHKSNTDIATKIMKS